MHACKSYVSALLHVLDAQLRVVRGSSEGTVPVEVAVELSGGGGEGERRGERGRGGERGVEVTKGFCVS